MCDFTNNLDLESFPSIAGFGSQKTGKTYMVKKYLEYVHESYTSVIICAPNHRNHPLLMKDPKFFSIPCQDSSIEAVVKMCEARQEIEENYTRQEYEQHKRNGTLTRVLLIVDDFIGSLDFKGTKNYVNEDGTKKNVYKTLAARSRHLKLSVIWLAQSYTNSIPTILRNNIKYFFIFDGLNMSSSSSIYEAMPPGFNNKYEWFNYYRKHTRKKYSFIFIDKTGNFRDKNIIPCKKIDNEFAIIEDKPRERKKRSPPTIPIIPSTKPFPTKNKDSKRYSEPSFTVASNTLTWLDQTRIQLFGSPFGSSS